MLKVPPLILLPIRRSTKQKGKRCLSRLCPFCCFLSAVCTLLLGSYFLRNAFRNRPETLWKCIRALQAFLQPAASAPRTAVPAAMPSGAHGQSRSFHTKIDQFLVLLFPFSTAALIPHMNVALVMHPWPGPQTV